MEKFNNSMTLNGSITSRENERMEVEKEPSFIKNPANLTTFVNHGEQPKRVSMNFNKSRKKLQEKPLPKYFYSSSDDEEAVVVKPERRRKLVKKKSRSQKEDVEVKKMKKDPELGSSATMDPEQQDQKVLPNQGQEPNGKSDETDKKPAGKRVTYLEPKMVYIKIGDEMVAVPKMYSSLDLYISDEEDRKRPVLRHPTIPFDLLDGYDFSKLPPLVIEDLSD